MARYFGTPIILSADPASAMQAATKNYTDIADIDAQHTDDYPLDQYGIAAATLHVDCVTTQTQVATKTLILARAYVPMNTPINGVAANVGTAGSTPGSTGASGFAVYTDAGVLVSSTVNDYTIFTTAGWRSKALPSQITAQGAGRFVYVGMIPTCSTGPKMGTNIGTTGGYNFIFPSGTHYRCVSTTGITAWPASFTPSAYSAYNTVPCLLLY
jgi:hypothetical protein